VKAKGFLAGEGNYFMQIQSIRRRLLDIVQQQALPRLSSKDLWQVVNTEPPFLFPRGVTLDFNEGAPISPQEADPPFSSDLTHNWASLLVQSSRYPCMGFVVKGSIDWRIGITARMAREGGGKLKNSNYVTLGIPESTFVVMPPGVPYAEGDLNHWQRSVDHGVPVKVLWVQFHRFGMQCFTNYTKNGKNTRDTACYIPDSRTIFAAETLVEELRLGTEGSKDIVQNLLQFCMQRLERGLQHELREEPRPVPPSSISQSSATEIVEQACVYIEANYQDKITLGGIASQVYISPSYLARLFRAEKGISITEYLTRFRMEYVCTLLSKTDLRINHIGKISGYNNHSYFCQLFHERMGCTPLQYRKKTMSAR
jgi:AraC-like DNA-binding protein